MLRTTQNAFCPEAATAGGVGVADAVFLVFRKQFTVSAVEAGSEFEIIKLSAEGPVFFGVPDIRQRLLLHITEGAVGDLPADITHIGVAVVQQRHAGANLSVRPDEGHALPDKFAVAGFSDGWLVIEIQLEILLAHQTPDAVCCFRNVQIKEGEPDSGKNTALSGAGVHIHQAGIEHLILRCFICGGDIGYIHFIHQMLGDEKRELCQLVNVALHGNKGNAQRNAA